MGRYISTMLLSWLGWRIVTAYEALPPKYVLIAVPHTSNWDFPVGLLARSALGLDIRYVGKASLFRPPLGWLFRWLGGYPVDRSRSTGYVDAVVDVFNEKEAFAMCIAPEGTRSRVDKLKSGFYYIALGAQVPIIMAGFDWQKKCITISAPFHPTGNKELDFSHIDAFFVGTTGKNPEQGYGYRREHDLAAD
ncbi:lysophospholipid acyltransferase family protein [Phaeodactylibacter xiamenensis]|uniref:lysophospholipid acyltransferase family protein n=1 Tax=Phaeodactylibacter xiamenensis TaxID=1524460 RepID=UPI003CCBFF9F